MVKEKAAGSSSWSGPSQEGRAVSGEGEAGVGDGDESACLAEEGLASFLFFEEDVLKGRAALGGQL